TMGRGHDEQRAFRTASLRERQRRVQIIEVFLKMVAVPSRARGLAVPAIVEGDPIETCTREVPSGVGITGAVVAVAVYEQYRSLGGALRGPNLVIKLEPIARSKESTQRGVGRSADHRNEYTQIVVRVTEIYASVQGETGQAGRPCTLVRTTGCDLRCVWCDSPHALYGGRVLSIEEVI